MPTLEYSDAELGLSPGWDEHLDPNIRKEIREARKTQRVNADLQAKVDSYERERVLARAGVPQDKRGDAFARVYEGPTDDPEKVKAAYEELFGKVEAAPADETDPTSTQQRIAEANANGTNAANGGAIDLADAIKGAKDAAEVKAIIAKASSLPYGPGQLIPRLPEDS